MAHLGRDRPLAAGTGFKHLVQFHFRRAVFDFFLPAHCRRWPAADGQAHGSGQEPCSAAARFGDLPASSEGAVPQVAPELTPLLAAWPETPPSDSTVVDKDTGFGEAIERSLAEAVDQENSDLAKAMVRSKAEAPAISSGDGVVMLRLDRRARAVEVASALLEAPALAMCRARVVEAGCELQPDWAGGAWLLLPMTKEIYEEIGLQTCSVHLLMLSQDEAAVRQALKTVPKKKRPQLRTVMLREDLMSTLESPAGPPEEMDGTPDHGDDGCENLGSANSQRTAAPEDDSDAPLKIVVERTFLTVKFGQGGTARGWHSAPSRLECDTHSQ